MSIQSDLKKHQTFVTRLAASQRKIVEEELQHIRRLATLEIVADTQGSVLKDNLRSATQGFADRMTGRLETIAEKESAYIARKLKIDPLGKDTLSGKLLNENMRLNLGSQEATRRSLKSTYSKFATKKADEIAQIIRDGKTMGLSSIDIMKNVDERINGLYTTQAKTLTETSTLYASNLAQRETIAKAHDRVMFTLGESQEHTDICLGLAGQVFDVGDAPTPPLHWGCNSYLVPVEED